MKKISIIIPVFNEEDNIIPAYEKVTEVMYSLHGRYDYEIVFSDNNSTDKSFEILKNIADKDYRVKVAKLSRNFGYQKSIYTAYCLSSGDAAIQLDCDLQDPPEMMLDLIKEWEKGAAVVYGIRRFRKEAWYINLIRKVFYRVLNALSEDDLPVDAGDFRLIDKKIIKELRQIYDYSPYIRGAIFLMGFKQVGIIYDRNERMRGESKFSFKDLFSLATEGILNHSIKLLRIATYIGLLMFMISGALIVGYFAWKLVAESPWPAGFATITILILLSLGINSLCLGIIGEYIGRIYLQTKMRPISIIEEKLNLDE